MLSVKYVFLISQETNGRIVILKTVLKSDLWPGSEKCGFDPKFEDNNLKSGHYRVPKLPPLFVKYICPISRETNHPITIPKIVLKLVLWRGSESAQYFCIFQFLCIHSTLACNQMGKQVLLASPQFFWRKKEEEVWFLVGETGVGEVWKREQVHGARGVQRALNLRSCSGWKVFLFFQRCWCRCLCRIGSKH